MRPSVVGQLKEGPWRWEILEEVIKQVLTESGYFRFYKTSVTVKVFGSVTVSVSSVDYLQVTYLLTGVRET